MFPSVCVCSCISTSGTNSVLQGDSYSFDKEWCRLFLSDAAQPRVVLSNLSVPTLAPFSCDDMHLQFRGVSPNLFIQGNEAAPMLFISYFMMLVVF